MIATDARKSSAEVALRAMEDLAHEAEQNVGKMLRMVGEAQQAAAPPYPASPAATPTPEPEFAIDAVRTLDAKTCLRAFTVLTPGCDPAYTNQFKQLRAKLSLYRDAWTREKIDLRVVSVVSPDARDGKTFVATNLAAAIAASSDSRVLLIDANPFAPALRSLLNIDIEGGLCEALKGSSWENALWRVPGTELCLLPFGAAGLASAIEPFSYKQLPRLLATLCRFFDWIVIDGPSFDNPADAELIAHHSDGSLLVVQKDQTRFETMHQAIRRLPERQLLGVVLNGRTR